MTDQRLEKLIAAPAPAPAVINTRAGQNYDAALAESPHLDGGTFTAIHPDDVERLFDH